MYFNGDLATPYDPTPPSRGELPQNGETSADRGETVTAISATLSVQGDSPGGSMANFPQGPQYPQPPMYPPPGSMAQPTRPTAMQRAVSLMYTGAAVALVNGVVSGLTMHNATFYAYSSTSNTTTVHNSSSLVAAIIGGIIGSGLWLWMAWKTGAGRNWARVLSTVFFGVECLAFLGSLISLASSG